MEERDRIANPRKRNEVIVSTVQSALIAALYILLTLLPSFMSYGMLQLRVSEALTVLPAIFPSAITGVFLGCLLSNILNPSPLGLIDVVAGSLTTLVAAFATWRLAAPWRRKLAKEGFRRSENRDENKELPTWRDLVIPLLPQVLLNALVVGVYLPFLMTPQAVTFGLVAASCGLLALSQSIVVFGLGLPLVTALARTPMGMKSIRRQDASFLTKRTD